jgi:hypothetical protein
MQKIKFFSCISEARKFELSEILERVESIVEKHDTETLGINGMFQLLKAEKPELSKLTAVKARGFPERDKVSQLYIRRKQLLYAIKHQCTIVEKAAIASQTEFAKQVIPIISLHLKDFEKANLTEKSEKLNVFLNVLDAVANKAAIAGLGMTVYVDELKGIQAAISANTTSNKTLVVIRAKSQTQQVKNSVLTALRNLFRAIELASVEHTDKDYSQLIGELNNYLASFNAAVKTRRTRRMNMTKKETAASTPTSVATAS